MYRLWNELKKAKEYRWIELSHRVDNTYPFWGAVPAGSASFGTDVIKWGNPMLECQIQTIKFPEQFGTHINFPTHHADGIAYAEEYGVCDAAFPLCVIDISEKVKENGTYCVTVDDIRAYEAEYGEIPAGAFAALRTDWYRNWPDRNAMLMITEDGIPHFPGWSSEAIRYIYEVRGAAASGHETLYADGFAECIKNGGLVCEPYVLSHGKMQIELLCRLDEVPAAGAVLIAAWPRFRNANGLPCRVWAICE